MWVVCFLKCNKCSQDRCCNSKPFRSDKWRNIRRHWQCCHHHIVLGFSSGHHHTQSNSILDHQFDWCISVECNHHKDMWKDTVYKYHKRRDHNCWQYHKLDKLWVIDMSNNLSMNMVDITEKLSWGSNLKVDCKMNIVLKKCNQCILLKSIGDRKDLRLGRNHWQHHKLYRWWDFHIANNQVCYKISID